MHPRIGGRTERGERIRAQRVVSLRLEAIEQSRLWRWFAAGCIGFAGLVGGATEVSAQQRLRTAEAFGLGAESSEEGSSSREVRLGAIRGIPFQQLTPEAAGRVRAVVEDTSYFRRMPTQTVECDAAMYQFLVRHPEVVVGLWDLMGITKVSLKRTGEYQLVGNDGAGTTCKMDLIYGSDTLHIYQSQGGYQGSLWPRELKGHCVVVLHNRPVQLSDGRPGMVAWMDAFMRLENAGADLVVKTLGPMMGKTADQNFVECANFFSQVSMTARLNPQGLQQVAVRLKNVSPEVRNEFVRVAGESSMRQGKVIGVQQALTQGIATSTRRMVSKKGSEELGDRGRELMEEGVESPSIRLLTNEGDFDPKP